MIDIKMSPILENVRKKMPILLVILGLNPASSWSIESTVRTSLSKLGKLSKTDQLN